ncbi:MAG: Trm112 family protein [Thermodesulfovibrionales bacterium]
MAIDRELLEILACPKCKGDIKLVEKSTPEGGDGLICEKCKLLYPIKDGIPVMLINEAIPLDKNGH